MLKGEKGPIGGPKQNTTQPISRWDPSQDLYPFLQVGGRRRCYNMRGHYVLMILVMVEVKCDPMLDGNTYVSSCDCDCGSEGLFCQIAAEDNKIPTGELCNIEDGSPVCCDAPDGVTKASDPKNPCVVGRLSPFIRVGLSAENQLLDNNSEGNHDGNKLGFCYKPCKPSPGPGPATSNCGEDEKFVLNYLKMLGRRGKVVMFQIIIVLKKSRILIAKMLLRKQHNHVMPTLLFLRIKT